MPDLMDMTRNNILCEASVATFRTPGNAQVAQHLFTLENGVAAGGIDLEVLKLEIFVDSTVALAAVSPVLRLSRPDVIPTGGTTLTKKLRDTLKTSNSLVVARGATGSDGGALSAPVCNPEAAAICASFMSRIHTAVGQIIPDPIDLLPWDSLVLHPGQSLLLRIDSAVGTSNPATNHYLVYCAWREYTSL